MTDHQLEVALTASHLSAGMIGYTLYGAGSKEGIQYAGPESPSTTLLDIWGQGCLELHQELSRYAPMITRILEDLAEMQDFPGVFHYEVTEEFGEWFAEMIVENGGTAPMEQCCKEKIALLTAEFFSQLTNESDDLNAKDDVLNILCATGWAKFIDLRAALFPPMPAVEPKSPWAIETVAPKFKPGDAVFHAISGGSVARRDIASVKVQHEVYDGPKPRRATHVTYELTGWGWLEEKRVFATYEEAFDSQ